MSVKLSDVRKLITDITEYIEKPYSRILQHTDNKVAVSTWISNLNKIIDETIPQNSDSNQGVSNSGNGDVVSDDLVIDEKYNFKYQYITANFLLAKIQDQSTAHYASAAKTILETLKVILDKQIDDKPSEKEKELENKELDKETTNLDNK